MVGFRSYCDEFGHPKDPHKRTMGIAGLLAWEDDWKTLSNRWREIQNDEAVPTFHMTDFVHHTEEFSDERWESQHERRRVLALFLNALNDARVIPVGAAVSLNDFNGLTEDAQSQLVSPYHVAFQEVTSNLAFAASNKALLSATESQDFFDNKVAMVYAKLRKFTGPAEELWNAIEEHNLWGRWMSSYTVGDPKDYPPLQAADIWAYSLGHVHEHHPPKKEEATVAFDFFLDSTSRGYELGHRFYTFFDRQEMLSRLGLLSDVH